MVRLITLSAHIWHGFTADFPEGRALKEIIITKNEENQRLDKFLLKYMNKASKGFIYKMLRKKRIKYNGGKAEGNELLQGRGHPQALPRRGNDAVLYGGKNGACGKKEFRHCV